MDPGFNDFVAELSGTNAFKETTQALTQQDRLGAFDQELVLRFFAMKNYREAFKHDVGDYLTEYMEKVSDPAIALPFDRAAERAVFERTFSVLSASLGQEAFSYANKGRSGLTQAFSVYHYEAITLGVQSRINALDPDNASQMGMVHDILMKVKLDSDFIKMTTGGGKNSPGQLRERIRFVENRMEAGL